MTAPVGRRERKKAQTRRALADAALRLFAERGFDRVGVKEVADAADVSVTTLFSYFPCKEALVFDADEPGREALAVAVRERPPGRSVLDALRAHMHTLPRASDPHFAGFLRLVRETPALQEYAGRMWRRHERALAAVIAEATGRPADDVACAALARFVVESRSLVVAHPDPVGAVDAIFDLLERGWSEQ